MAVLLTRADYIGPRAERSIWVRDLSSRLRRRYAERMSADAGRHIAELFAVPLNEFTRARNAKAAQLKAAGHGAEAQALRRLGRPTVSLWAANQLARLVPKQVGRFIDLVQEVRRKQLTDPRAAAEAMQAQRTELTALTNRAAEAMTKAGYRAAPAALRRISDTVLGAAVDRRLSEDLRHGRLTAEVPAPGFEVLAGGISRSELRVLRGGRAQQRENELAAARLAREAAERERLAQAEASRRDALQRAEAAERADREVHDLEQQLAEARRRRMAAQREAAAAAKRAQRPSGR
jgi:hypothetical protein